MAQSKQYSFEDCAFSPKRERLADFLTEYLLEEKQGFVLNLNGSWGVGKTHFLKSWENKLSENYPVVYIDAWKTDFADDPLLVVVNSIIEHLKIGSGGDTFEQEKKIMGAAYKLFKPIVKKGVTVSASMIGIDSNLSGDAYEAIEKLISGSSKPEEHFSDYRNKISAISEFHAEIQNWADCYKSHKHLESDTSIFVLVDELDRCRPTYAIELLETVKHMFELPNFIFVIATDTEQLKHSIKAVYGSGFNSGQYLTRFFDRSFQLPEPDNLQYLQAKNSISDNNILKRFSIHPLKEQSIENLTELLGIITQAYGLELRDIDKLTAKLNACFRYIKSSEKKININIICLIHGIIIHQRDIEIYKRLPYIPDVTQGKEYISLQNNLKCSWLSIEPANKIPQTHQLITQSFKILNDLPQQLADLNSGRATPMNHSNDWFDRNLSNNQALYDWLHRCKTRSEQFADWEYIKDLIEMSASFDQENDIDELLG
ncbi:MAG: hypothetical protein ACI8SR_000551 [Oceanicoccus sp.]|jgi:hypothetical protein